MLAVKSSLAPRFAFVADSMAGLEACHSSSVNLAKAIQSLASLMNDGLGFPVKNYRH